MKLWMRRLIVTFSNGKQEMIFGDNYLRNLPEREIEVKINKYLGPAKDAATIKITNMSYEEILLLVDGKFTNVEVKCGYKETGLQTVFKGGVIYVSNSLGDRKTNTAIILCASELVARFQSRNLNLCINSGVNVYSALKAVCRVAGISNSNISTQLKRKLVNNISTAETSAANYIQLLTQENGSYISNADKVTGSTFSIFDISRSNGRVFPLSDKLISLEGGYPQLTKDGLSITVSPTFNFMCGDTVEVDNSLIDISARNNTTEDKTKGYYLDPNGLYMIYQMTYNLNNRSSNFGLSMLCKAKNLFTKVLGGKV